MNRPVFSRRMAWLLGFLAFTANGALNFAYRYFEDLASGRPNTFLMRLIDEGTGTYGVAVLFPAIVILARRFPVRGHQWYRALPPHLAAMIVFCLAHTSIMWGSRTLLYSLAGLGHYDYGIILYRYPMEAGRQVVAYWSFVGLVYLFDYYRKVREGQVASAELQARLAQAQLENLRLQLQPHFLFNALNTISSVMYEDVARADTMLAQLSDLLRRTLRPAEAQQVSLEEELTLLKLYLNIMQARFGEALQVDFAIEPEAHRALVPQLILQPLVENSIRHGSPGESAPVRIQVGVRRDDGMLLLEVSDRGPGIPGLDGGAWKKGIGLTNTAERLEHLYGAAHQFLLENGSDGGLQVSVRIPFREAS